MRMLAAPLVGLTLMGTALMAQAPASFRLPNGLEVLLVERHDRPLLRAHLRVVWPDSEAPMPTELALLTRLVGTELPALTGEAEDARAELRFRPGLRAFTWTAVAPSSEQETVLGLMAQQVFRPGFDPARVEQERRALRTAWRDAAPDLLALDRFRASLGLPTPLNGEAEGALDRPGFEGLLDLRRALLRPERTRLVLQGDLSFEQARQLALLHFGTWHAEAPAPPSVRPVVPTLMAAPGSARGLDLWLALSGDPLRSRLTERVAQGLQRAWQRVPAPFDRVALEEGGAEGLILLRLHAPLRTGSVEALKALKAELERLRQSGLPAGIWKEIGFEASAQARVESLHPAQGVRRLGLEGLNPEICPASAGALDAELARLLDPAGLRFLLIGAEPDARPELEGAGFKPLLWFGR